VLDPKRLEERETELASTFTKRDVDAYFSPYDLKRLESYAHNLLDFHVILDLLPTIARLFFLDKLPVSLSAGQCAILLAMGLQHKNVEQTAEDLTLQVNQILALFQKTMRKVSQFLRSLQEKAAEATLPKVDAQKPRTMQPIEQPLDEELEEGGEEVSKELKRKHADLLGEAALAQYSIAGKEIEFEKALSGAKGSVPNIVSIKSSTPKSSPKFFDHKQHKDKKHKKHKKSATQE